MTTLYAQYHKMEFRPHPTFTPSPANLLAIGKLFDLDYVGDFENKSSSDRPQYKTVETYRGLINLEFLNSPKRPRILNRLEIHGEAFETLPLDIGKILTKLELAEFTLSEVHSRVLLPHDVVSWDELDEHFKEQSYTSNCRLVTPLTDPKNDYAKTWQAGKRPSSRSSLMQGKRLTFYQADKIHPELAAGTSEMEIQLFGYDAHSFVYDRLSRDVDLTVKTIGVVRSYFEFKELTGDSNQCRRPTATFWKDIVGNTPAIHLPKLGKPVPNDTGKQKKFREMLYSRRLTLGNDQFVRTLADWLKSQGLSDVIAEQLTRA